MQTELDLKQTASGKESKDWHVRRIPRIQAENIIRVAMTTLAFKSRLCADNGNTALAFRNSRDLERGYGRLNISVRHTTVHDGFEWVLFLFLFLRFPHTSA